MRKNKLPSQIRAAVLTICLYSIFFGQSPLGASDAYAVSPQKENIYCPMEVTFENRDVYSFVEMDQDERAILDQNAKIVVEQLKYGTIMKTDHSISLVDTGFSGEYSEMKRLYERSRELYYGNLYYGMAHKRNEDGSVRLFLQVAGGNPGDAYQEHTEAYKRLKSISATFTGTAAEKADQIFEWVCRNVKYADKSTLNAIQSFTETSSMDYNGINASTYTAIMTGRSTCYGTSGLMLALLEMNGIHSARVMNPEHAYNAVFSELGIIAYDATNGVKGTITELTDRYGDFYEPVSVTGGEICCLEHQNNFF